MRVGIFTDTYPPYINGVSTSISMLEKALKDAGHEVFIVTVNPTNMSYNFESDNIIRIPGIKTGIYDYRLTGIYPLRAIKIIKKWNLDVIHSHTEFGIGTFARIIAKQLHIPLVHTYHTMYEDYVYYITKGHFDKTSKKIVRFFTKFYCDTTTQALIVPSRKTYKMFNDKYKMKKEINIIPTGMDTYRFSDEAVDHDYIKKIKKELGIGDKDFVVLSVGRVAKEKNLELLIEGFPDIVKKHKKAKLVIVGGGPDLDNLKELAKKKKLTKNVIFTGPVLWEDIANYYHLGNVFVTASNTETQGLTLIEAMSAGLPVVCMKDESFEDILRDNGNGFYFTKQEEYVEKILYLIENPAILKSMHKEALLTSEMHNLSNYAKDMIEVYEIAKKRKKRRLFSRK